MNKMELVSAIAEKSDLSKRDARGSVKCVYRHCCRRVKRKAKRSS